MQSIETRRLILRSFSLRDWRYLKALIVWYNASPYAAYDHPWPASDKKIKDLCRSFAATEGFFAVCSRDTGDFIGYVSISPAESQDVLNLSYCFNQQHHGNGYAYESCMALLDYAFVTLKAIKVVTGTASENIPACVLLKKLGFEMTGCAPCSFHKDVHGKPIEFLACRYALSSKRVKQASNIQ